ncbi:MAG: cupredoxin domain-containing protein [Actinobacteria bacterium]|nr:cupredoxin domain-containing protein [Actinomycetota bacterium]
MNVCPGVISQLPSRLPDLMVLGMLMMTSPLAAQTTPVVVEIGADGVQRTDIAVDSYEYSPKHIVVKPGIPVELNLHSLTMLTPHNFIVNDPAAGFSIKENVVAGKTVTVRFTPYNPGIFPMYCDKKLLFFANHREKGMEGKLEVR